MKPATERLLLGLLTLIVAIVMLVTASVAAKPTTLPNYVLSAFGLIGLCLGAVLVYRARRPS